MDKPIIAAFYAGVACATYAIGMGYSLGYEMNRYCHRHGRMTALSYVTCMTKAILWPAFMMVRIADE